MKIMKKNTNRRKMNDSDTPLHMKMDVVDSDPVYLVALELETISISF